MFRKFLFVTYISLLTVLSINAADKFVLVIDAGHGGHDAGAVGKISKEKDINLSVALAFGGFVEKNCPDVKVIYTRKTDVFIPLMDRANIANKAKANLFVSIHTNSVAGSKTVRGFETYTLGMHRAGDNLDVAKRENSVITMESDYKSRYQGFDPNSAESYIMFEYMQDKNMENSVKFARQIQKSVCSRASRLDKGVHQAGFLVLRETSMPSCLIELGFISTPDEERQLNDPTVQANLAFGIYQAFQKYRGKSEATVTNPIVVEEAPTTIDTKPSTDLPEQKAEQLEEQKPKQNVALDKTIEKPVVKHDVNTPMQVAPNSTSGIVFKVQILASSSRIQNSDARLKGLKSVDFYQEAGLYKYTYGESSNYNEINELKKSITTQFPQAFVIAFRNGEKMNINEAIKEWRTNKK